MTIKARQLKYMERTARFPLDFNIELGRNGKPEVHVPPAWEQANLVRLGPYTAVPDDRQVPPAHKPLTFSPRVNINAAPVFSAFFETLKAAGMLQDILTYDGSFNARLKRGAALPLAGASKDEYGKLLSNHSRGTAIDLNAQWNPMGHPAAEGVGNLKRIAECARNVIVYLEIAGHKWPAGLLWGGDWKGTSIDGMHFEVGTFEP